MGRPLIHLHSSGSPHVALLMGVYSGLILPSESRPAFRNIFLFHRELLALEAVELSRVLRGVSFSIVGEEAVVRVIEGDEDGDGLAW